MERKRLEELRKFADHALPSSSSLCWRSPRRKGDLCVFWFEENESYHMSTSSNDHISIQDRIKNALIAMESYEYGGDVLVQFWAAKTTKSTMTDEGGHLLTTSDQPFALNRLTNENLNHYKKQYWKSKLVDEGEERNPTNGSVSRVFQRHLPEMSLDVSYYTVKEYPGLNLALDCGFKSNLALPVFAPSLRCCVGVLELLLTKKTYSALQRYVSCAYTALQGVGLETMDPWQIRKVNLLPVKEELKGAMVLVRETHSLPYANIWGRCQNISSVGHGRSLNRMGELLVPLHGMEAYDPEGPHYNDLLESTLPHPLRLGQGPVGKVFHSDKPCFCRDVTQLSIIDYPNRSIFKSCFVVCLQSASGNRVYAIEFFLPPGNRYGADLHKFLSSISTTLKQNLRSFVVVTGDIENDVFFTEIDNLTESNMEASMVKGKNVILPEQGNTSFPHNTLNTSSGHKTTSSSYTFTDYEKINTCTPSGHKTTTISSDNETTNISSGHETVPSTPLSVAFANEQIPILKTLVQLAQARIDQLQKEVAEYEASSHQR